MPEPRGNVEIARLVATAPEGEFADLAKLVASACGALAATIEVGDGSARSGFGPYPDLPETGRADIVGHTGERLGSLAVYGGERLPDASVLEAAARLAAGFLEARLQAVEIVGERRRFRSLLDLLPEHIVAFRGEELVYEIANRAFLSFSGKRPAEVLGTKAQEGWNVPPEHLALLRHVYSSGESVVGTDEPVWSPPKPDEPSYLGYYDFGFRPLRDDDGNVEGILVHSLEVTEKVLAQRSLAESEERFRTVFDSAPDDAMILTAADRRIVAWNPAAERICGWSAAEAIGHPLDLIFTPEDRDGGMPERLAEAAAKEGKISGERWHVRRDGSRFWGSGTLNALLDEDQQARGYLKIFRDATQRKIETATLAFLRDLTDTVVDLRDPSEIIRVAERMLGEHLSASRCAYAEVEEERGTFTIVQDWSIVGPSSVGTYPLTAFGPRAAAEQRAGKTLVIRDVDAELSEDEGRDGFHALGVRAIVCCPLIKNGALVAMMAVHQDSPRAWSESDIGLIQQVVDRMWSEIERARAERSLRELNEELERRVEERTRELEATIAEAEAFNYSISHDLRAPLRAIIATSGILIEEAYEGLREDHRTLLDRQAHNGKRLSDLIDDLLTLSRLSRAEIRRRGIDMTALAEEIASELRQAGMGGRCEFAIEAEMTAEGDEALVRLVLTNLLQNACKFSPEGGLVTVRQSGSVFEVEDQGVGFDMAYAHKIFLPFERLVHERDFPGTGIGLASVERIIRRHGGRIWAESEPGMGARFRFTLGS